MFIAMTDVRDLYDPCIKAQFSNGTDQSREYVVRHREESFQFELVLVGFSNKSLLALDLLLRTFPTKGEFRMAMRRLFRDDGYLSTRLEANKAGVHEDHSPAVALARLEDHVIQIEIDMNTWSRVNRPFNLISYNFTRSLHDLAALGHGFEDLSRVYQSMNVEGTPNAPIRTYRLGEMK